LRIYKRQFSPSVWRITQNEMALAVQYKLALGGVKNIVSG